MTHKPNDDLALAYARMRTATVRQLGECVRLVDAGVDIGCYAQAPAVLAWRDGGDR